MPVVSLQLSRHGKILFSLQSNIPSYLVDAQIQHYNFATPLLHSPDSTFYRLPHAIYYVPGTSISDYPGQYHLFSISQDYGLRDTACCQKVSKSLVA